MVSDPLLLAFSWSKHSTHLFYPHHAPQLFIFNQDGYCDADLLVPGESGFDDKLGRYSRTFVLSIQKFFFGIAPTIEFILDLAPQRRVEQLDNSPRVLVRFLKKVLEDVLQ